MSKYLKGYKIRLYPTEDQKQILDRYIGVYRFVYNWAKNLEDYQLNLYDNGESDKKLLTYFDLTKLFTIFRHENKWLLDIPVKTCENALRQAYGAYDLFFKKVNKYPKFKSKKYSKASFVTRKSRFYFDDNMVKIEGLSSKIKTNYHSGHYKNDNVEYWHPVVSKDKLDRYWISFSIEKQTAINFELIEDGIGIDVGIRNTYTLSNGNIYQMPNLSKYNKKINTLVKKVRDDNNRIRKQMKTKSVKKEDIKYSNRAKKRYKKLVKIHERVRNIKKNFYNETTRKIVDTNPKFICMETFKVRKSQKDGFIKHWDRDLLPDFYTMRIIMERQCDKSNIPFILAPSDFPSSQICHICGNKKHIHGHNYICNICGYVGDRDINAAINLCNYALSVI